MPKRDKFDKEQADRRQPTESDPSSAQSDELDLTQELGPDQSAIDAYNMTDPALGDVDRICGKFGRNWAPQRKARKKERSPAGPKPDLAEKNFGTKNIEMRLMRALNGPFRRRRSRKRQRNFRGPILPAGASAGRKTAGLRLRKRDPVFSGFLTFSAL